MLVAKVLNKILNTYWMHRFSRVNKIKTLLMNLRCLPLKDALKFPIYIYENTEVQALGTIKINAPIQRGMIRIGYWGAKAAGKTRLRGRGTYIFNGEAQIWGGCIFENMGTIEFGSRVAFAEGCKVICKSKITLGNFVHFGFYCTLMDTDFHYVINTETYSVKRNTVPIVIDEGTWVSSDCKFMKGSYIPKNSIVIGGCLINKNYSGQEPRQIYVGSPGKPYKAGYQRIYNDVAERSINEYFEKHPDESVLYLGKIQDLDKYCYENCLNFYNL